MTGHDYGWPDLVGTRPGFAAITLRPLVEWPGQLTDERRRCQFRSGWYSTQCELAHELHMLHVDAGFLQVALEPRWWRQDGRIRANAPAPSHPGVILSFVDYAGPVVIPCDTFTDWRDNVRGIALGMGALRTVDRYGIAHAGQQYAGWRQIAAESSHAGDEMLPSRAARILVDALPRPNRTDPDRLTADLLGDPLLVVTTYRLAAGSHHPDRGGTAAAMALLNQAKAVLDAHHGRC